MDGHVPPTFEGHFIRHGPFPGHQQRHPTEVLEHKMAKQDVEIERFTRENQRLAATHVALRHDLFAAQQEMQKLQTHIGSIQTESDIQIRILLDKMAKMEVDIRAGESIRKELQKSHQEAKILIMTRQELSSQIQHANQELQKAHSDVKILPELHAQLNSLRQEHQRLRVTFEYEKGLNIELVQQMQAMENNLVGMAGEVEKLRTEVAHVENRSYAPNPYVVGYRNPDPYAAPPPPPDPYAAPYRVPPPPDPYAAPYGAPPTPDPYAAPPPPPPPHGVPYVDGYERHHFQFGAGPADDSPNQHGIGSGAAATGVANGSTGAGGSGGTGAAVGSAAVNSGVNGGWEGSHDAASAPPPPPVAQR